jgi:GH24 family phage-related lysozyme (muramidase)
MLLLLGVDPLAEKYYSVSPYAYCLGNPVNLIDPDGMESIDYDKVNMKTFDIKKDDILLNEVTVSVNAITSKGVHNISSEGMSFIQRHEGFGEGSLHRNPYNDSKGYATVGYGHLLHKSSYTTEDYDIWSGMTKKQGLALLKKDLQKNFIPAINRLVKVPLSQNQFDAVTSFTYNVGVGSLKNRNGLGGSRFLKELNGGNYNGNLMMRFHSPSEINGRRQDEVNLFNYGEY